MRNISKSFSGVPVLHNVSFEVKKGEIHGLIGENGAGKSTLMNIVSGLLPRDEGDIIINEKLCYFSHPIQAEKYGIVHIHQELNVLPELAVLENLFLGKEFHSFGLINKKAMQKKARDIFDTLEIDIALTKKVCQLSVGHQQLIEIAKALLSKNPSLIILDEPTSSLANEEIKKLFEVMLYLKQDKQVSFIYVSHRMHELFRICDSLTVLRDGVHIATLPTKDTNMDAVIQMMIGRKIEEQYGHDTNSEKKVYDTDIVLRVRNIMKKGMLHNISFNLYKGEILGFYGMVGAGRTDLLKAIFGIHQVDQGDILLKNVSIRGTTPYRSIQMGIGFLSENRKEEGILSNFSVKNNISISNFKHISKLGFIRQKREREEMSKLIHSLSIKTAHLNIPISSLSGGNQQKSLIARCLNYPLAMLLLDEPTRGIDVASKQEIYAILYKLARQGLAIIMVSSDLLEIMQVSHRVAVMHEGKLIDILSRNTASQEAIMRLSTNTINTEIEHVI